jgi:hypothetical protein
VRPKSNLVLPMLSAVWLTACATQRPPLPVAVECPRIPQPPPQIMEPPAGTQATTELAELLQSLIELLSSAEHGN